MIIGNKKLLGILVLGLLWCNVGFAEQIYCKVDKAYKCDSSGCKPFKSEIFINLDTDRNTYQRGDSKGIDTYDMRVYKSGAFVIAEVSGSAFLKIDLLNTSEFVEIVHLGLNTYNNFGKCNLN